MVVIGIIAILFGLSLPKMLEARQFAKETSAISALRQLHSAQGRYFQKAGAYTTIDTLVAEKLLDPSWDEDERSGFVFNVGLATRKSKMKTDENYYWAAYCWPKNWGMDGASQFLITSEGEIFKSPTQLWKNDRQALNFAKKKFFKTFDLKHLGKTWNYLGGGNVKKLNK